ncbi:Fanconi anaemia protein FANCD2 [Mortierella sp. GBAus27b]|nr:Fanconi anaemia protein FANCD2 [Mortierella sp. GBAus27b]
MAATAGPGSFYTVCQEAGLTLGTNGSPNVLHVEPIRFERDTTRLLQRAPQGSDSIGSFLMEFQDHIEDSHILRMCLVPVSTYGGNGPSVSLNESLIRMLLNIDILQPRLVDGLLDRIFNFIHEDDKDSPIPKLILQQLKWLNNIIAPEHLTAKLFEVINMSPMSIQRDTIVSLPEIVPDSEHRTVVLGLVELMESSSDLMVPILDALSNLYLQSDVLANARSHVMDKLESADLDDLPIVLKFLLQTVEQDTVGDAIETIRSNLDFSSINKLQKNNNQAAQKRTANQTPEVLILDSLKTGIKFQKFVTDAWYRALSTITKPGHYKVIDVMVMFILHSIVSLKKKIEVLIRRMIIEGTLTRKLLQETILVHGESLREYMPSVLSISESLLRASANHPIVARTASVLYTCAFEVSDAYYRQEIIGSLLVHIGSGSIVEIDASLAVLQNIAHVSRSTLSEYSAFIKGILDYLDNLTLEQIRLFFVVLGSLALEDEITGGNGTLLTDLNIIIRKQLSNPLENYKKIGVMGAIAMVQAFGIQENGSHERGSSSQAAIHRREAEVDPLLKVSVQYLKMVSDACRKSSVCLALTYDELASLVLDGNLNSKLVLWVKEEFSDQFAETFVCGANEVFTMKPHRNIAIENWMNLDGPESELSISIMPTLCADMSDAASQDTTIPSVDGTAYLCSLFRLLQATEKMAGETGLDDIDGLLGCGITMFKREYLEDIAKVYSVGICHTIAQGLLCAINWFREISNAFSSEASDQTIARIIVRLQQMMELEVMLRHVLKSTPGFKPLEASQAKVKDSARSVPFGNAPLVIESSYMGASVKKDTWMMDIDEDSKPFVAHSSEVVTFESLAPYLRELEVGVFHVFRVQEPIIREVYEISEAAGNNAVQLGYPELLFLLRDLHAKVNYKLPALTTPAPFGKKAQAPMANNALLTRMSTANFVNRILAIIPHVVTKTRIMLSELSKDIGQGQTIQDSGIILDCVNASLKILLSLLSWNEIKGVDQKDARLALLKSLALDDLSPERVAEIKESAKVSVIAAEAFRNLSSWRKMMPTFESTAMLLEVLDKVLGLVPQNPELSNKVSVLSTETLSIRWPPSAIVKPDRLAYVLGLQIGCSDTRLEMINEYVTCVLPSFLDQDDDRSELHPMLNANTFTVYTKALHIQLASLVGEFSEENFDDTQKALDHISGLCLCFQRLAAFVKSNDKREVLAVTLRHSKTFMEQFIKRAIPFLGAHFRGHQDKIAKIFKNHLQAGTRSLQNVCGHAKASKEQTLIVMVPPIRKTMETLIFEVKLMLENNDAGAAFWLGNLKHRNLRGEEISSQLPVVSEDEQDDEAQRGENEDDDAQGNSNSRSSKKTPRKRSRADTTKSGSMPRKAKKDGTAAGNSKKRRAAEQSRTSVQDIGSGNEEYEPRIHTKRYVFTRCSDATDDRRIKCQLTRGF